MSKDVDSPNLLVYTSSEGIRLDKFLAGVFPQFSRTYFQRLILHKNIKVDDHQISPHHKLHKGQQINISWPNKEEVVAPADFSGVPFPIIYEDASLLVINKPPNLLCHPTGWRKDGTSLVEILRPLLKSADWPDDVRPGLVHRLDRDTSGVLLFARSPESHAKLSKQFSKRQIKKTYLALVKGAMDPKEGTLECLLARHPSKRQQFVVSSIGRQAITKFKVIETWGPVASLVELYPLTGRTHQIRVQLSSFKHPILGDKLYGGIEKSFEFVKKPTKVNQPPFPYSEK